MGCNVKLLFWSQIRSIFQSTVHSQTSSFTSHVYAYIQHIQIAAACLVFNLSKFSHVTPPPPSHPLASCCCPHPIQDDVPRLQGCHQNCTRLPPNTGQSTCRPAGTVITESKQRKPQLFSVLAPLWWNECSTKVRTAESLAIFCKRFKTHLFRLNLNST